MKKKGQVETEKRKRKSDGVQKIKFLEKGGRGGWW